jgi:hypothetical protein
MTATTAGVGLVVIVLLWSGVIAASGLHTRSDVFRLVCGPACLLMIAEMLFSFRMYTGRARHQSPAA